MKKKDTPPDVWIAHKKARKKIASAKWYAKVQAVRVADRNEEYQKEKEKEQRKREKLSRLTPIDQLMFDCRWQHQVHGWPCRPEDIPAVDWLALIRMGKRSMERIMAMPILLNNPEKKQKCMELCIQELTHTYRRYRQTKASYSYDEPSDTHAIATLQRLQHYDDMDSGGDLDHSSATTSSTISCNQEENVMDDVSTPTALWSTLKRWRERLVGTSFPWTATWLGIVFADLVLQGRSHRWPGLLKYMYQLSHTNPKALPIQDGHSAMINNPNHVPNTNPP